MSSRNADKKIDSSKQEFKKQMNYFDSAPLVARTLFPVCVLSIIMITLVKLNIVPEQGISWIQEILNTLVLVIGLIFVIVNIKKSEILD